MRQRPTDVSDAEIAHALREVWALEGADPRYVAVGGGSHHWRVEGQAWLTVDDLDDKAFLGATPDAAFASLQQALDTARALRANGLEFVVAPVPTRDGHSLFRLSQRYGLARYPLLAGHSHAWASRCPSPHSSCSSTSWRACIRRAWLQPASSTYISPTGPNWTGLG